MFKSRDSRTINRPGKPIRGTRLRLESLEDRAVPATIIWTGGFHTSIWQDPRNWSPNVLPGLSDDVVIGSGFTNPVLLGNAQVGSLTVSVGGHLTVGNGGILSVGAFGGSALNLGTTTLEQGTIYLGIVNQPPGGFTNRGLLAGSGAIVGGFRNEGGTVQPGPSAGTFSFQRLFSNTGSMGNGTLVFDLNGLAPGTGYDQIVTTPGPEDPPNNTYLGGQLIVNVGFAAALGDAFRIIDNRGTGPIAGAFSSLPEGALLTAGGQSYRISYVGGDGNDVVLTRADPNAALVAQVIVGDGTAQRSRITQLKVAFDRVVSFAGDPTAAFGLQKIVSGVPSGSVELSVAIATVGTHTEATLTFTSDTTFSSLIDGRYRLTVFADQVLNNGVPMTANSVTNFHRFYGDANGDTRLDIADFGLFSATYGKQAGSPGYVAYFDYNGDGRIDVTDFGQFSARYFTTLP